jgi:hypothetical protein
MFQGYEMVSFDTVSVPPPAAPPPEEDSGGGGTGTGGGGGGGGGGDSTDAKPPAAAAAATAAAQASPQAIPSLTQAQARAALLAHISHRCCYGSGAAKQMSITHMDYVPAFHYELQTFTEKRETSWTYAPHKGGEVDSPARGPAPLPWDIEERPSHMFKAGRVILHTYLQRGVAKEAFSKYFYRERTGFFGNSIVSTLFWIPPFSPFLVLVLALPT